MAATLQDIADRARVSRATVSLVLNGRQYHRVSKETRQRIARIAEELNYQANPAARQLKGKRSHSMGILVASAGDPLRSFLVQYLDAEAVRIGCHTMIGNTISNPAVGPDQLAACMSEFARRNVDGVFCAVHHWMEADRAALAASHPTVFYEDPHIPGAAHVSVDREAALHLAVEHLVTRGRRRIGLALMSLSQPTHEARRRGYVAALHRHNLPHEPQLVFDGESTGLACAWYNVATDRWEFPVETIDRAIDALVRDQHCDAIIAHDDFWAATMIRRMRSRGIHVPGDVAIVGFLNHYLADWTDPPLTTIDLQHRTAARAMVTMLERTITHGPLPEDERIVKVQPRLIVRESA